MPVAGAFVLHRLRATNKRYRLIYYDGRGQIEMVRLCARAEAAGRDYDNVRLPLTYIGPRPTGWLQTSTKCRRRGSSGVI